MKPENFELRLQRQPLRRIPAGWREQILSAAGVSRRNATASSASEDQAALIAGWRLLFGRFPLAWASLAALWMVLAGVNLTLPGPFVSLPAPGASPAALEALAALDFDVPNFATPAADLLSPPKAAPAPVPPAAPHRPSGELRRETDTGEIRARMSFNTIA